MKGWRKNLDSKWQIMDKVRRTKKREGKRTARTSYI